MDLRAVDFLAATPVGGANVASRNWLTARKIVMAGPDQICLSLCFQLRCPPALSYAGGQHSGDTVQILRF